MKALRWKGISVAVTCGAVEALFAANIVNVSDFGDGTPSVANAQAACEAAAAGDTIRFPAGTNIWSSGLTVSKPLNLVGAGSTAGGTRLVADPNLNTSFFNVTGISATEPLRISGFCFDMVSTTNARRFGINISSVSLAALRIDHNEFHHGYTQIHVGGSKGVIDHNRFYNGLMGISFTAGTTAQANASWDRLVPGTEDALFIEDNEFVDDADYIPTYSQERIGTYNGGKLVVRYNRFDSRQYRNSTTINAIMTHGSAAGGVPNGYWQLDTGARRGQSIVEIYGNVMEGKRIDFLATLRGSANLVFSNRVSNTVTPVPRIYLREEEYTVSQWSPSRREWPAEDQVHNTFIWANLLNGSLQTSNNIVTGDIAGALLEGRDYFLHEPQASGGYAYFSGANGASGSYPTDGTTYPTKGTMLFSPTGPNAYFGYKPYTYPHPLVSSAPVAPGNLRRLE